MMKVCIMILCMGILFPLYGQSINSFNKDELAKYMDSVGIKYIPLSIAQAIHESGNFKSSLFLKGNNMFGMKLPVYRETLAIGKTKGGYAIYYSWKDSVLDFYLMQQGILKKHPTYSQYISYIYRNYAKDPLYRQKLQKYIK